MIRTIIKKRLLTSLFSSSKQWLDKQQEVEFKTKQLSKLIKKARHPIFFTGAGCSTSMKIPDYRSGSQTIVPTGPGVWNRDYMKQNTQKRSLHQQQVENILEIAEPSITHMVIKTLLDQNIFKYLVSQNTDGFHLRSGIPLNLISELHGNHNLERCESCQRKYLRDYRVLPSGYRSQQQKKQHQTGRNCENCGGKLFDSIIYFGEKLPKNQLIKSFQQAAKSDLILCIGSSLTVKPAVNVPLVALQSKSNLCIINIQETALDSVSSLKINDFCDNVMSKLMGQLNIPIKQFQQEYYIQIQYEESIGLIISGKDKNWNNFTFLKSVIFKGSQKYPKGNKAIFQLQNGLDQYFLQMLEIQILMHRQKPSIYLVPSQLYKLRHGELVRIKVSRVGGKNWTIQHL